MTMRLHAALGRYLPEQRLFLRSETQTRFIRLRSGTQAIAMLGGALLVGWTIIATAILLIDRIGSGGLRHQAQRERSTYEHRLNDMAAERDARAREATDARQRFDLALREVSKMQSALLASERHRNELETGTQVMQATLRRVMAERDDALQKARAQAVAMAYSTGAASKDADRAGNLTRTVRFLTDALNQTATERDTVVSDANEAYALANTLEHDRRLAQERDDRIFGQIEDAMTISIEPLDKMFRKAGLNTDSLLKTVRRGYSGQGGPLTPISFSSMGSATPDPETLRANGILQSLDKLNLYRLAAEKAPFAIPLKSSFRVSSPYGWRRHPISGTVKMHEGMDMAGTYGSPVYATADGVITHAGWSTGYGRLIEIKHRFGIETRYAHLAKIRVKVGQKVSRGDRIGDMGSSGRSTGSHLHYEVRVDGKPVNPMIYIKAARNVF